MATESKNKVRSLNPKDRSHRAATNRFSEILNSANITNFFMSDVPHMVLYSNGDGEWLDFETEVLESIKLAFYSRRPMIEASVGGSRCLFDFLGMEQIYLNSDNHRPIGWVDVNGKCFHPQMLKKSLHDNNCEIGIDIHADGMINRKAEGVDGKEEPGACAIESFRLRQRNLIMERFNRMPDTSASAGVEGINIIEELPHALLDLVLSNVVKQSPSDLGNIMLTSKHLYKASTDNCILKEFDAKHLAPKLPNLDDHGERFLNKLLTAGNKEAMLLLGTHLFFNKGSKEDGLEYLKRSAETSNAQGLYNYSIALIIPDRQEGLSNDSIGPSDRQKKGYNTLQSMLEQNEPLKKTIRTCRINFRKMLNCFDYSRIPRTNFCSEEGPNHWDKIIHPRFLQNEEGVSCTLCGIDFETFKLRNDFA